jgi:hypothetical protein
MAIPDSPGAVAMAAMVSIDMSFPEIQAALILNAACSKKRQFYHPDKHGGNEKRKGKAIEGQR